MSLETETNHLRRKRDAFVEMERRPRFVLGTLGPKSDGDGGELKSERLKLKRT